MGDSWLQNLVVRGPASDIEAFRKAAASSEKPEYWTVDPQCRTQVLSFAQLRALLPPRQKRKFRADPEEPWDLVVDPIRRFQDGSVERTYKFQLGRSEPDGLMIAVSRIFPRLCFVVGCVAPTVNDQSSRLIHNGRSWTWRLSERRKNVIMARVPEGTKENADEVDWAIAEANWAMMDEVVAHWEPKMKSLTTRMLRKSVRGTATHRTILRSEGSRRRRGSDTGSRRR